MRILLITCAVVFIGGCSAFGPPETVFNTTLDRAHAVDCNVKSLEWTPQRTRLECFEWPPDRPTPSRSRSRTGSDV